MFRSREPIRRTRSGIEIRLAPDEREMLRSLMVDLRALLDTDDPGLRRLFPTAYAEDPDKDAEYQILARSELVDRRRSSIDVVEASILAEVLDAEQAHAWMLAINQLRLVLGTRLDVGEDDDEFDPSAPDAAARAVYLHLGYLLDLLIRAM